MIEDNPDVSLVPRSALRVVVRSGSPPSLATFDVASPDTAGTFKSPTHTLTLPYTRDDVWVGVFGLSQKPQLHEFHVQALLLLAAAPCPPLCPFRIISSRPLWRA